MNIFTPTKSSVLLSGSHPIPQATDLLSVTTDWFAFFIVLCKRKHSVFTFFCLSSFTLHNYYEILLMLCVSIDFFYYYCQQYSTIISNDFQMDSGKIYANIYILCIYIYVPSRRGTTQPSAVIHLLEPSASVQTLVPSHRLAPVGRRWSCGPDICNPPVARNMWMKIPERDQRPFHLVWPHPASS